MTHLNYHSSDHRPILAELVKLPTKTNSRRNNRSVKFEDGWIAHEECRGIIEKHWKEVGWTRVLNFSKRIDSCLAKLKKWSTTRLGGSIKNVIFKKEKEIKRLTCERENSDIVNALSLAEINLTNLLEEEEKYWSIRSREEWLLWGDRNTKWFHSLACHRRKRNKIDSLVNENDI